MDNMIKNTAKKDNMVIITVLWVLNILLLILVELAVTMVRSAIAVRQRCKIVPKY